MFRRPRTTKLLMLIAMLAVAAGGAVALTRTSAFRSTAVPQTPAAPPPVGVVAALIQSHDVSIYLRGVGTVIAYNNVLVRSQITGELVKISFHQGQQVKKGDVVAVIDRRPYQAQLDQAIANATATRRTWRMPRSTTIVTPISPSKNPSRNSPPTRKRQLLTRSLPSLSPTRRSLKARG